MNTINVSAHMLAHRPKMLTNSQLLLLEAFVEQAVRNWANAHDVGLDTLSVVGTASHVEAPNAVRG